MAYWKQDLFWNKKPKAKVQTSPIDLAEKRAEKYFSLYIRMRDCIRTTGNKEVFKCCSCGKLTHIKNGDAGHFISRSYKQTKFDERNNYGQCKPCNRYKQGMWNEMFNHIKNLHGQEVIDELMAKSKELVRYVDYAELADYYRIKYNELKSWKT